jgi:DNA-binding beta-propeller fold protein YncE
VTGIAYANGYIWFTESMGTGGTGSLGGFDPTQDQCAGTGTYTLPASVESMTWPSTTWGGDVWPAEVTADPSGTQLWVTDFEGYSADASQLCHQLSTAGSCGEIDEVDVSNVSDPQIVEQYVYPSSNVYAFGGAEPWGVVADPTYVYAIDYGDSNLVRIDKSTGHVDEVPLPLTSDDEDGYGLALHSNKLYLTLSDDTRPAFGAASTIGYIDLDSWMAASQPNGGVIYGGISKDVDRTTVSDFRGIAADSCGDLVITDRRQQVRLVPKSQTSPCSS